ncbi:MAG: hypothetical protein NXI32_13375 [bacterium]|nr:hypothetical protein [bacterium]
MKSIVAAAVTCAVLFGASFAFSTYWLHDQAAAEDAASATDQASIESELLSDETEQPTALPVSLLPDAAVSIEAVVQMSDSIKKTEEQLLAREQRLVKKEQRLDLLLKELKSEEDALRAFGQAVEEKIDLLDRLNNEIALKFDELDNKILELKALRESSTAGQQNDRNSLDSKVNDVKDWFSNLPPEQASDYLREFANNGKMEFAAALLQKMPDRQKSKILGAMSDPLLVEQLIDSLVPGATKIKQ